LILLVNSRYYRAAVALPYSQLLAVFSMYGHLFPRGDDGAELAAAERALLA
jgi:hypothetical protein